MADRKLSLIEQAKSIRSIDRDPLNEDFLQRADLLLAWIRGEVETGAVGQVLGLRHNGSIHSSAGTTIRILYQHGLLNISRKVKK